MKKLLCIAILAITLASCKTGYIAERYVKNKIESHVEGEFSTVTTKPLFKNSTSVPSGKIELLGYKYKGAKGVVLTAYNSNLGMEDTKTIIIELTKEQCKTIVDKYDSLTMKSKKGRRLISETLYNDFTIAPGLFISIVKTSTTPSLFFWVKGDKYKIKRPTEKIKKLAAFFSIEPPVKINRHIPQPTTK